MLSLLIDYMKCLFLKLFVIILTEFYWRKGEHGCILVNAPD
jgi:hypothetical protein